MVGVRLSDRLLALPSSLMLPFAEMFVSVVVADRGQFWLVFGCLSVARGCRLDPGGLGQPGVHETRCYGRCPRSLLPLEKGARVILCFVESHLESFFQGSHRGASKRGNCGNEAPVMLMLAFRSALLGSRLTPGDIVIDRSTLLAQTQPLLRNALALCKAYRPAPPPQAQVKHAASCCMLASTWAKMLRDPG